MGFSPTDWEHTVAHRAECLAALGLGRRHVAAVLLPFGPWFSGDNLTDALLQLGAMVLPVGLYGPHLEGAPRLMAELGVNAVITTPSTAWRLTGQTRLTRLEKFITVGEHLSAVLADRLTAHFGVEPRSIFAASEVVLGYQLGDQQNLFRWDPQRLHLEVLRDDGTISDSGIGELLATRRYGEASPLLRYPLGDRVELNSPDNATPNFRHLGRIGHAFGLIGGVKIGRAQLERFLDGLPYPVNEAYFHVDHGVESDLLRIELSAPDSQFDSAEIARHFIGSSLDVADVHAGGLLRVEVCRCHVAAAAKRRLRFRETWSGR